MLQSRDLADPVYLDAINSLLVSGEYPHLFSNDEMDGLLQVGFSHTFHTLKCSTDPLISWWVLDLFENKYVTENSVKNNLASSYK